MTASENPKSEEECCSVQDPCRNKMIEDIRCDSKKLKADFIDQMGSRLSEIMDHVVESFEKSPMANRRPSLLSRGYTIDHKDKKKGNRVGRLPEKEFQCRPSVLTQLLELPHFRTIHHIFIASLILMLLHTMLVDLTETGMVDLGLERLLGVLGSFQSTWTLILSLHFASIFILYPCFYYWAISRLQYTPKTRRIVDRIASILLGTFLIAFICVPARTLWKFPLPWASSMIATMEQGRLLMKMYAFVQSNLPRALNFVQESQTDSYSQTIENEIENVEMSQEDSKIMQNGVVQRKPKNEESLVTQMEIKEDKEEKMRTRTRKDSWISWDDRNFPCPDFTKYLYFLFAPTLIYRDNYPRTKTIRWNYVCWNLSQCVGCALYANFVMTRFCIPHLIDFGAPGHSINLKQFLALIFSFMLPGTLMLILAFYLILHTWQNVFAEVMCFGDRLFYKDWWNCSSFAVYYKTWNCLVHDWLYTYIFKHAWESGLGKLFKPLPTILVFLVSAIFHEYILCMSFNFFFPVNLILFGFFGQIFVFIGNRKSNSAVGNVLIWMSLISGTGIIICAYSMEAFARMNCTPEETASVYYDFFVPRTISCGAIRFQWS